MNSSPPKRCSAWDRILSGPSVLNVEVMSPTDPEVIRSHFRVLPFQAAAAAVAAGDARAEELTAAAGVEYRSRVAAMKLLPPEAWEQVQPKSRKRPGKVWAAIITILCGGLLMVWGSRDALIQFRGLPWAVCMLNVCGMIVLLISLARRGYLAIGHAVPDSPTLRRQLMARECCDCGYDLRGVPPGLPSATAGVDVGPAACPECGVPWPLVPPGNAPLRGRLPSGG